MLMYKNQFLALTSVTTYVERVIMIIQFLHKLYSRCEKPY